MNVTVPRAMPVALAPPGPPRPPLVRHRSPRMLGGVAQGVATHVGVPLPAVRLGFVVTALAGGFGVVLYLWLWALVPAGPESVAGPRSGVAGEGQSRRAQAAAMRRWLREAARGPATTATVAAPTATGVAPAGLAQAGPAPALATDPTPADPASADPASADPTPADRAPAWTDPAQGTRAVPAAASPPVDPTTAPVDPTTLPAPTAWHGNRAPSHAAESGRHTDPLVSSAATVGSADPGAQAAHPVPGPLTGPLTGPLADALAEHPPAQNAAADAHEGPRARRRGDLLAGALLVVAGAVLLASRQGWAARPGLVIPLLVVGAGAIIAYAQLDEVERARWANRAGAGTRVAALRVIGGLVLVVVGVLLLVVQEADVGQLGRTLLAALAVLAGAGLVLAPWGVRLWRDLDTERAARVRESARADIAAHLHDSVLQTLALIQRRSHDPAEVARLARAQERDLRGWLYGAQAGDPETLAGRVAAIVAEAEDVHGSVIDVVTVGDRPVDDRIRPLLAALREAVINAARHAGAPVQVYVESGPQGIEAFVKDRGMGFDLESVPEDRLGVRESVVGRMERHGGSARVRSAPGEGTEVRLLLPDEEEVPT